MSKKHKQHRRHARARGRLPRAGQPGRGGLAAPGPGGREGEEQGTGPGVAKTGASGHLQVTTAEGRLCAEDLAAQLDFRTMPSDYYLGLSLP